MSTIVVDNDGVYDYLDNIPECNYANLTILDSSIRFNVRYEDNLYSGEIKNYYISFDELHHKKSWYVHDFDYLLYFIRSFGRGEYPENKYYFNNMLVALFKNLIALIKKLITKSIILCTFD